MVLNTTGRNRFLTVGRLRNWFRLIRNISNRSIDLAWLRGGTGARLTSQTLAPAIFRSLFDRLPVQVLTSDLHHRILRRKSIRSELMILECSLKSEKIISSGARWHPFWSTLHHTKENRNWFLSCLLFFLLGKAWHVYRGTWEISSTSLSTAGQPWGNPPLAGHVSLGERPDVRNWVQVPTSGEDLRLDEVSGNRKSSS